MGGSVERDGSPARLIDAKIEALGGWRGKMPARVRAMIRAGINANLAGSR